MTLTSQRHVRTLVCLQALLPDMEFLGETAKLLWRVRENLVIRMYYHEPMPSTIAVVVHNEASNEVRQSAFRRLTVSYAVIMTRSDKDNVLSAHHGAVGACAAACRTTQSCTARVTRSPSTTRPSRQQ